jgi:hypothetical protein
MAEGCGGILWVVGGVPMCSAAMPIAPGAFVFEIGAVGGDSVFCRWSMMGRGLVGAIYLLCLNEKEYEGLILRH